MRRMIITFSGNREGLHKQLKNWSVEAEQSMNSLIMDFIEKHLDKHEKTKTK
jgi:hypothetical protein